MRGKTFAALAVALVSMGAMATDASAQRRDRDDWVELGCRNVSMRAERDTIRVGRREGRFQAIRLHARGGDIEMLDLRVVYVNGDPDDIRVRSVIRRGDRTRPLELRGDRGRSIDQVDMVYRAVPNFRGNDAEICVEGLEASFSGGGVGGGGGGGGGGGRDWEELGCKGVALFGRDRDSIRVGRREGRFRAIRVFARGADVEMLNLRVIYTNGEPDDLEVRHLIRRGERTRPLDLRGRERSIDRVEMVYRTVPNFKGLAEVCIEGLQ